jgi:hypothetical protein
MSTLIATQVLGAQAYKEFQLLLYTLEQWCPAAEVFVLTDTPTSLLIKSLKTRIRYSVHVGLDAYSGLSRADMQARSGSKYATLWHECMMEKVTILEHIFSLRPDAKETGVWFLNTDVCLLAPLPVLPTGARIALSPHSIRAADEARIGRYNAGFFWIRDVGLLDVWRRATYGSRYYEQAALEAVGAGVSSGDLHELPVQNNFGVWRYMLSADAPPVIQGRLGYNRTLPGCGLTYEGEPLRSLQTNWGSTNAFTDWIRGRLEFVGKAHAPAKAFVQCLGRLYPVAKKA